MSTTPYRIEYRAPESWTVWADEDGVHVRTPKGDGLEAPDLERLIQLVYAARDHHKSGNVPAPRPPAPEERRAMFGAQREEYNAKRASRAVYDALAPHDTPF